MRRRRYGLGQPASSPPPPLALRIGKRAQTTLTPTQRQFLFEGDYQPRKLGCGSFACAYAHRDPRYVVKLTRDPSDAIAALLVRDNYGDAGHPNLAAIRTVRRLVSQVPSRHRVYGIVSERIDTSQSIPGCVASALHKRLWQAAWQYLDQDAVSKTVAHAHSMCPAEPAATVHDAVVDVAGGRNALLDAGVAWDDSNPGNIGLRARRWVIFDYGVSNTGDVSASSVEPLAGVRRRKPQRRQRRRCSR